MVGEEKPTVLVIDDEEVVRDVLGEMLDALGFQCITASSGEEGLIVYQRLQPRIQLVILDIEMPGISGDEVYRRLKKLTPAINILVTSGYTQEYLESYVFHEKIDHFVPKPFHTQQLFFAIQHILKPSHA